MTTGLSDHGNWFAADFGPKALPERSPPKGCDANTAARTKLQLQLQLLQQKKLQLQFLKCCRRIMRIIRVLSTLGLQHFPNGKKLQLQQKTCSCSFVEMLLNQENVGADPIPTWLPAHPVQKLPKCWFSKTQSAPGSLTVLLMFFVQGRAGRLNLKALNHNNSTEGVGGGEGGG